MFNKINAKTHHISKSTFRQIIADVSYIEDFEVEKAPQQFEESIITLFDTKMDTPLLFKKIGIDILSSRILDNRTVFLDKNQAKILYEKAPYLVAMATENLSNLSPEDFLSSYDDGMIHIPSPSIEPTIGVIDTLFDTSVYFHELVEYHDIQYSILNLIAEIKASADAQLQDISCD